MIAAQILAAFLGGFCAAALLTWLRNRRAAAEVTDGAPVTHRCDHQAAAYDRKTYADEIYRQLRTMREAVLAIHTPVPTWTDSTVDTATGETEQNALYADNGTLIYAPGYRMHCQNCRVDTPWPCPTAAAAGVTGLGFR